MGRFNQQRTQQKVGISVGVRLLWTGLFGRLTSGALGRTAREESEEVGFAFVRPFAEEVEREGPDGRLPHLQSTPFPSSVSAAAERRRAAEIARISCAPAPEWDVAGLTRRVLSVCRLSNRSCALRRSWNCGTTQRTGTPGRPLRSASPTSMRATTTVTRRTNNEPRTGAILVSTGTVLVLYL